MTQIREWRKLFLGKCDIRLIREIRVKKISKERGFRLP